MNSRPATSVKESLHQGCLPVNVLHELSFFDKIQGCVLQGCSFIKTLVHFRLVSQKKYFFIFFKQLVFGKFSKKNL